MSTPTPRTDAKRKEIDAIFEPAGGNNLVRWHNFACQLESELQAASLDARRYRWLRDKTRKDAGFTLTDIGSMIAVRNFPPNYLTLDAAIDAALSKEAGP